MLPSRHIIVSLSLGAIISVFTKSTVAGLLCFFSGFLVDVDHVLDYVVNEGPKNFSLKNIYRTCRKLPFQKEKSRLKKVYLVFHSWEAVIIIFIGYLLFKNKYILAIAVGYTSHLFLDVWTRAFHPMAYFISYRYRKGFSPVKLFHARFIK